MNTTTRIIHGTPDAVFDVLANGWSYSQWVVGASRVRDVSDGWPADGTNIHHSVGAWPLLIDDTTTVRRSARPTLLELTVRAWPSGEGFVRITCRPEGVDTEVTMEEDVTKGPAVLVPRPVRDLILDRRNQEALRRLAIARRASASRHHLRVAFEHLRVSQVTRGRSLWTQRVSNAAQAWVGQVPGARVTGVTAETRTAVISMICPGEPPRVSELMKTLDGQVPDGVQIRVDTSVGKQIDAGVIGGPPKTSG